MQTINAAYIRTFKPCSSGIDNFEEHYPCFEGTIVDILSLDKVPYNDKVWLACKVVPLKQLQMWSVLCAESVLPNFEKEFPNDNRVRECLETVKKVINRELPLESAARSAEAAESAARSAAWSAVLSARSAAWSAVWSARSAARSAESAEAAELEKEQEDKNIMILISLL
jgi:hypothetical protein